MQPACGPAQGGPKPGQLCLVATREHLPYLIHGELGRGEAHVDTCIALRSSISTVSNVGPRPRLSLAQVPRKYGEQCFNINLSAWLCTHTTTMDRHGMT